MSDETTQAKILAAPQHVESSINEITIRQYFKFMCEDANEIFTVAFLLDKGKQGAWSKGNVPGFGTYHGKIDDILEKLRDLQSLYGIDVSLHVTLNRTNAIGRKTKDIESARVLCVDLDGVEQAKLDEALSYRPSFVVQSAEDGAGRFHIYWLIETLGLTEWKKLQLALAYKFGGDLNLDQVTKTIRVPGVSRVTKTGMVFVPTIIKLNEKRLNIVWQASVPWVNEAFEQAKEARALSYKQMSKLVQQAIKGNFKAGAEVQASGRNNFMYWAIKKQIGRFNPGSKGALGLEAAQEMSVHVNEGFSEKLEQSELDSVVRSGWEHGVKLWESRRNKYMERLGKLGAEVDNEKEIGCQNGTGTVHVNGIRSGVVKKETRVKFEFDFDDTWLAGNSFSDYGLAARVLQQFESDIVRCGGDLLAFNHSTMCWKVQKKGSSELPSMVAAILADLREDARFIAAFCLDDDGNESDSLLVKAIGRFETAKKTADVLRIIESSPRLKRMERSEFDANPDVLYVKNGLLNLITGKLRSVTPNDYLLAQSKVLYSEKATCNEWLKFLSEVFDADTELINFVQEVFGYSLQGCIDEQVIFCHYGTGANGKSKLLSALGTLMGDYFTILDPNDVTFSEKLHARPFERVAVRLEERRVVVLDDLEIAERWSESTVKNLTCPKGRARGEHEKSREIVNRAKVHLGLNVAPKPQAENHGLLRRLCFIPYLRRFKHGSKSSIYIDKIIETEISGILNWAIEGYRRWKVRGNLELPAACTEAINEYRQDNFNVESLILEMWEKGDEIEENFITTEELLKDFNSKIVDGRHVSGAVLGREIRATLDAKEDRKRFGGPKKRGFFLKRKITVENSLLDKLE